LLGSLEVRRGGNSEALPASKRTRALLGYLVATGKPHTRRHLCDLLWDGPDDPRGALRWSLAKLRPVVNADGIARLRADRDHAAFDADGSFVDIVRAADLLAPGIAEVGVEALEEAALLLEGEFLDGLDLPDCYRFYNWCMAERERLGQLRRRTLEALVGRLDGDPARALGHARTLVAADPLSEAAHARFVGLLVKLGRVRDADAHYEYARELLRRELAAPLWGELRRPTALSDKRIPKAVLEAPAISAGNDDPSITSPSGSTPFLGRDAERRALESAVRSLSAGVAQKMMLFTGEPGIGKSRLLQFATEISAGAGVGVISAPCFEAEMIRPYGLWIDALRASSSDEMGLDRKPDYSAPAFPDPAATQDQPESRDKLFATVTSRLAAMAGSRPLTVALDDLQWIDEASACLLHYVLRTARPGHRVLFVGAVRDSEIDDNPAARRLLASLKRDRVIRTYAVPPLERAEIAALFTGRLSESEAADIWRACGGNPLFATEMARSEPQGRQVHSRDISGLIAERLERLEEPERELIQFASAIGRAFGTELVSAALVRPEISVLRELDGLERRGLLRSLPDARYDFVHDIVRRETYRRLSQPHRRIIHRRLSQALAEAARSNESLFGDLAHQAGLAQEHGLAAEACLSVGERCLRLFANAEAANAADRGLAHLEHVTAASEHVRLQISLFRIKIFAAASPAMPAVPELMDDLRRAIDHAESLGLHAAASQGSHLLSWITQRRNDTSGVRVATLHAEAMSRTTDEATRCHQLANTGRCLLDVEQEIDQARAFLQEADMLAGRLNLRFVELDWGKGLIARWDGDLEAAHAAMSRALALARMREERWREIECLVWLAKIDLERHRPDAVTAWCEDMIGVAARIGDPQAPMAEVLAALADHRKRGRAAVPDLEKALACLRAFDDKAALAYALNQYASVELEQGNCEAAQKLAEEALTAATAARRTTEVVVANTILLRASTTKGDRSAAMLPLGRLKSTGGAQALSARARSSMEAAYGLMPQSFQRRFKR
jgi:DNA-binding SARP family transcriptional activator